MRCGSRLKNGAASALRSVLPAQPELLLPCLLYEASHLQTLIAECSVCQSDLALDAIRSVLIVRYLSDHLVGPGLKNHRRQSDGKGVAGCHCSVLESYLTLTGHLYVENWEILTSSVGGEVVKVVRVLNQ